MQHKNQQVLSQLLNLHIYRKAVVAPGAIAQRPSDSNSQVSIIKKTRVQLIAAQINHGGQRVSGKQLNKSS
jgi:hypothetical protein